MCALYIPADVGSEEEEDVLTQLRIEKNISQLTASSFPLDAAN